MKPGNLYKFVHSNDVAYPTWNCEKQKTNFNIRDGVKVNNKLLMFLTKKTFSDEEYSGIKDVEGYLFFVENKTIVLLEGSLDCLILLA